MTMPQGPVAESGRAVLDRIAVDRVRHQVPGGAVEGQRQNASNHEAFVQATADGRLEAEPVSD